MSSRHPGPWRGFVDLYIYIYILARTRACPARACSFEVSCFDDSGVEEAALVLRLLFDSTLVASRFVGGMHRTSPNNVTSKLVAAIHVRWIPSRKGASKRLPSNLFEELVRSHLRPLLRTHDQCQSLRRRVTPNIFEQRCLEICRFGTFESCNAP